MTPAEIIVAANQRFNSVGDAFFPDAEAYLIIWQGAMQLAVAGGLIETAFTTSTVASTQAYDFPANAYAIVRVTYEGVKLTRITLRQDDILSLYNQATTATGTPRYYYEFGDAIYLRPVPGAVGTLKVWANCRPQTVSSASTTMEIDAQWHMAIVYLLLSEKCGKNKDWQGMREFRALWERELARAEMYQRKRKRRGSFSVVTNVDEVPESIMGTV